MKKYSIALACAAIIALATTSAPAAKADTVNIGGDIGVFSNYVWRGIDTNGNAAVQGDIVLSTDALEGLSATAWFSNAGASTQEWDFILDYSNSIEDMNLAYSAGVIYYTFLHAGDANIGEAYFGLSYDAPISPFVTIYYGLADSALPNFDQGDWWFDFGASGSYGGYDLSVTGSAVLYASDMTRSPSALTAAGMPTDMFDNAFTHVTLSASKDITVGDLTVTPSLTGTIPLMSKAADGSQYIYGFTVEPEVFAGVNIAF